MTADHAGDKIRGGENDVTGKPASTGHKSSGKIAALAGARAFPPLAVVMFHFSEGHHYSHIRPLDLSGHPWLSVGGVFLCPVGLHPHLCLLGQAEGSVGAARLFRFPSRPPDPALSPASVHAAGAAFDGGGLAGAGGPRWLSLHLRRQVPSGCQRQGLLAEPFSGACLEHDEHAHLERRLLVRQRGIRAVPGIPGLSLAGARRGVARFCPDRRGAGGPSDAALHLPAWAGHHLSQWRAARTFGFRRGRGHGGAVPADQATRPIAGMGAFDPADHDPVPARHCRDAHGLVAYPHGHLHRSAADDAGLCAGLRPRPDRTRLADAAAAGSGRMVLCRLSGPDHLAAGHPLFRAAALSGARSDRAGHALL